MLEFKNQDGLRILNDLKKQDIQIAYVGDVVGTGSSRKSAINSVIWHIGAVSYTHLTLPTNREV